jgi:hypothetical protein
MSIQDLIKLLQNRLAHNAQQRDIAAQRGDITSVTAIDADTASTQATLAVLMAV